MSTVAGLKPIEVTPYRERTAALAQFRDIAFINCPPGMTIPPLGICYIAEHLRHHGWRAPIFDLNIEMYKVATTDERVAWNLDMKNVWLDRERLGQLLARFDEQVEHCLDQVLALKGHLVGFTVLHSRETITQELVRRIRERDPGRGIVLGGPLFSTPHLRHEFSVYCDYDWAVAGEGELATRYLLGFLCKGEPPPAMSVPGLFTREDILGPVPKRPAPPIHPLSQLPYPRFETLDPRDYLHSHPFPLLWSRGCSYRCAFCESWRIWGKMRMRDPLNIHEELVYLHDRFGLQRFALLDTVINSDIAQLCEVARLISERGPKVAWEGNFLASRRMSPEVYATVARAGCWRIYLGLESGSNRILRRMKKPFNVQIIEENLRWAHAAGISASVNIITGFPGETEEDFQESLAFVRRNSKLLGAVQFIVECQVADGTDLMLHPERFGITHAGGTIGHRWRSEDGANTLEVRQDRSRRMHEECVKLGLSTTPSTTLTDGHVPIIRIGRD